MFSGFLSKTCSVGGGGFCLKPSGSFILKYEILLNQLFIILKLKFIF
jgi:hypothetical protein